MRRVIFAVALFSGTTTAAAQSRWTFSAGPEWTLVAPTTHVWGMRARAEYDLIGPARVFGLRLEGAARWGPTQSYFHSTEALTSAGTEQRTDLMLGLTGSISPIPRARLAPYLTTGIYLRQEWRSGSTFFSGPAASYSGPAYPPTHGDVIGSFGLGLRARVGGRAFQLEFRRIYDGDSNSLTFGTRLPF